VGAEREGEVRERGDERADRDDARGRDAIGERQDDEHRERITEEIRGHDPAERGRRG